MWEFGHCRAIAVRNLGIDRQGVRQGWFQDTVGRSRTPAGPIAPLRLDGDAYESTKLRPEAFFDQIVPGGYLILGIVGLRTVPHTLFFPK